MKTLLTDIQTDLKNAAGLSYINDANIVIVLDENLIPQTMTFPALGIKDGPITKELVASKGTSLVYKGLYMIHIIIYVEPTAGETPIIGQASPSIKGVMDIRSDIHTVLHQNLQSYTGVLDAYCPEEGESELISGPDNDFMLLKKRLTYQYEAYETISGVGT